MAVSTQVPLNVSAAAAGATIFPYDFKIIVASDLLVVVDDVTKVMDIDYTLDGVGVDGGGDVTFLNPMVGGEIVVRKRNMAYARDTDYQNLGDLRSSTLNNDQDAPVLMIQQLADDVSRAFKAPIVTPPVSLLLPLPVPNYVLGWNSAGTALISRQSPDLVQQTGLGSVVRYIGDKLSESISLLDFIPTNLHAEIGGGSSQSVDVSTYIQSAINAAEGRTINVPAGRYRVDAGITATSGLRMELSPNAILDATNMPVGGSLGEKVVISASGSELSSINVTENIALNATQITVASTTGLVAGQFIRIESDQLYADGVTVGSGKRGFICRIKSVDDATHITLAIKSIFSFTVAGGAKITLISMMRRVLISGGRIIGGGFGKTHSGIVLKYTVGANVRGVSIEGCEDAGISVENSVNAVIDGNVIASATGPSLSPGEGSDGVTGYGVAVRYGSMGTKIINNEITDCRHGVAGGGTVAVHSAIVENNYFTNCGKGVPSVECHEQCFDWQFVGNSISGGDGGISVRGRRTTVERNLIMGSGSNAIQVQSFDTVSTPIEGTKILGNTILNSYGNGIQVDTSTCPVDGIVINDNVLMDIGSGGVGATAIIVQGATDVTISGNIIDRILSAVGTSGCGITMYDGCDRVRISDNKIANVLLQALRLTDTNNVSASNNEFRAEASHPVYLQDCNNVTISGGRLNHSAAGSFYGLLADGCTRLIFQGINVLGNAANTTRDGIRITNTTTVIVNGCVFKDCGRSAVYCSTSDRVIVTSNDARDVVDATKINIVGATTSVNTNNIT